MCTLKDCGVTATRTILVLGAADSGQQRGLASQEQVALQAQQRTERLDRLRKAAKALAQRSASRCLLLFHRETLQAISIDKLN